MILKLRPYRQRCRGLKSRPGRFQAAIPELPPLNGASRIFTDDGARARRARPTFMACQQVLDERGNAVVLLTVEVGVFEEIDVSRSPDSPDFLEYAGRLDI